MRWPTVVDDDQIVTLIERTVEAHEPTEDLNRERLVLLCFGIPTLFWFAKSKGKQTSDKILLSLFVIVNRNYI